jgi:hypothetical protein
MTSKGMILRRATYSLTTKNLETRADVYLEAANVDLLRGVHTGRICKLIFLSILELQVTV